MKKSTLKEINKNACGIDIGSEKIFIAVEEQPVKSFATFTDSYKEAIIYLKQHNVKTIAMEATGVYWFALYEMLEANSFEVCLVNGKQAKNVPGRKSDVQDCQWLQQLHSYGLLRSSFIPPDKIRQLRTYTRLRDDHISLASQHIQHMQKALDLMNVKLHNVISQITGVSGLRILKAILSGETDPEKLVELCDDQIKNKKRNEVILSLKGNFRAEHLFLLKQALDCWQFYQNKISECDKEIEKLLNQITKDLPAPNNLNTPKKIRHHNPKIDNLHQLLMKLTDSKDPSQIIGLTDLSLLKQISETGTDLSNWPTEKHFTSWLGLAPGKNQSGKKNRKRKINVNTKAGQIFKVLAQSVAKSKHSALAAFYRRIKAKRGPMVAMKALARKIAVLYYNVMTKGIQFVEQGLKKYQEQYQQQLLNRLSKQAKSLGMVLVPAN